MSSHKHHDGCNEYNLISRRSFLGWTAGAMALAAAPGWLPKVALADSHAGGRDVLVAIFLRGGADGLTICPPYAEDRYYELRPTLAIPRPDSSKPLKAIDLDGFFGFAPAMAPLMEAWNDKKLAVVHAAGLTDPTRSHFNAMYFMEVGQPSPPPGLYTGVFGRHLATSEPMVPDALVRGIGLGYGLPRNLVGGPGTVPVRDLANAGLLGDPASVPARRRAIEAMYAAVPGPMAASARTTLQTIDLLERIDFGSYQPAGGAVYPEDENGYSLKSTAALIRADVGVEAVAIDVGGWDTHENQMPLEGWMADLMQSLAGSLAAFYRDLAAAGRTNVIVTVQTEFGRNVFENASAGCDHGHGSVMLVMGDAVAGGKVHGEWPGFAELDGDDSLLVATDYRRVFKEIAEKRLGNPDSRNLFPDPGFTSGDLGIIA